MPKKQYDFNDNGKIDPEEREIMLEDRRRIMSDNDARRDAQRRMCWFSLFGMSNIYYVSIAAIVASYYGFTNVGSKDN